MHLPADSVSGKFADRGKPVRFGMGLDRMAHIAQPVTGHALPYGFPEAFLRNPDQLLRFFADGSDARCKSGVSLPAVKKQRTVDRNNVSVFQDPSIAGNAVHHLIVDARADAAGIALVVQFGWNRAVFPDQLFSQDIQLRGGHTGLDSQADLILHLTQDLPCFAHLRDLVRILQTDHAFAPSAFMIAVKIPSIFWSPAITFSRPFFS